MSKNKPGKHSEVASSNELLVAETQQRIVAVQEVGVEDNVCYKYKMSLSSISIALIITARY